MQHEHEQAMAGARHDLAPLSGRESIDIADQGLTGETEHTGLLSDSRSVHLQPQTAQPLARSATSHISLPSSPFVYNPQLADRPLSYDYQTQDPHQRYAQLGQHERAVQPPPPPQAQPPAQLGSTTPQPQPQSHPTAQPNNQPTPAQPYQLSARERLQLYRILIGILPAPTLANDPNTLKAPTQTRYSFFKPRRNNTFSTSSPSQTGPAMRTTTNLGVYSRILEAEHQAHLSTRFYGIIINLLYLIQIVLSAIITAISAYSSSAKSPTSISVTVMSVINAAATGVVAYLKARGLPGRKLLYKNQLRRVREYAEWRERQFAIDAELDLVGPATLEDLSHYEAVMRLVMADTAGATPPSASTSGQATTSKASGGGSPLKPPDLLDINKGSTILLDPRREAEIVEQMYWMARRDEGMSLIFFSRDATFLSGPLTPAQRPIGLKCMLMAAKALCHPQRRAPVRAALLVVVRKHSLMIESYTPKHLCNISPHWACMIMTRLRSSSNIPHDNIQDNTKTAIVTATEHPM